MKSKISFLIVCSLLLALSLSAHAGVLKGYVNCTSDNRFEEQCLPVVSYIEGKLESLSRDYVDMDIDRHSWRGGIDGARPSDDPTSFIQPTIIPEIYNHWDMWILLFKGELQNHLSAFEKSKKHIQSIQYIDDADGNRYLLTSLGDETETDAAAIQLIKTDEFAAGSAGSWDDIADQRLLNQDPSWLDGVSDYNHPGGSQLIGNFLFLALEDFADPKQAPATGVWRIDPKQECATDGECIEFMYKVSHPSEGAIPEDDNHMSTVAVTRLEDGAFLLAACVYEKCDYINFYKTPGPDEGDVPSLAADPGFDFIGQWIRPEETPDADPATGMEWWETAWVEEPPEDHWSDCGPQNMNFAVQNDGSLWLVMFGGETVLGIGSCDTGIGFRDHLYGYKVQIDEVEIESDEGGVEIDEPVEFDYDIKLQFTNKVPALNNPSPCTGYHVFTPFFHGLNFLAGSGLWIRPDGKDTIAYLATEHYDSCRSIARPVNGKTRWGVSSNWNGEPSIWADHYVVEVDEGDLATNTGIYEAGSGVTLSASKGEIVPGLTDTWSWSWLTLDGPDDSEPVNLTRTDGAGVKDWTTFDLVVNNVPPTADAGPDQVVECVYGDSISVDASGSSDPGADTLTFAWVLSGVPGSSAPLFDDQTSATPSFLPNALGTYLAEVTVTDDDGASDTDDVAILFQDTTPPVISSFSATPDMLWPPNGKMVGIETSVSVTDTCDPAPVCAISSIESNEPEEGAPDFEITAPLTAKLRAKRLGTGDGRIYTITVECSDYALNSTTRTTVVTVPHDQDSVPE